MKIRHLETPSTIASALKTDLQSGLSEQEAQARLDKDGLNELTKQKTTSPFAIFLEQFNNLVIWVLLIAVVVSFSLGETVDASAILSIVILNAVIGFVLEYRADRAMLTLQHMAAPRATVIRNGHAKVIRASHIVCGDILQLKSGDLIAADGRLYETASLKTNEASLTGESLPIEKNIQPCSKETALGDQKNMIFMGTAVVNGTGRAIVVRTGMQTEMGQIAKMLGEAVRSETPLQVKLTQIGTRLLWISLVIIISIFFLGLLRAIPLFELFMNSVSLAVAAIPEGLPAVVTVALALGVQRMVRRDVLVKRLAAVETMGCVQVICTDKTGTLTVGEMTARKLVTAEDIYIIQGEGYYLNGSILQQNGNPANHNDMLLSGALRAAVLCNNADLKKSDHKAVVSGDPTEIGLLIAAAKGGAWKENLSDDYIRVKEFPFNSSRKRMTVICRHENEYIAFSKGAPEIILERCSYIQTSHGVIKLDEGLRNSMLQSCHFLASEALRILAVAEKKLVASSLDTVDETIESDLVLVGLFGLQDPPHASVKDAVSRCKSAGIQPVMITGDHPATAKAIASELGIYRENDMLITGIELDKMDGIELAKQVRGITVYARVTAEHKLKIVRAWKTHQMIVAMTGDGVNDAPALKEASVGIAMGKTGTAVTKEAADIIVLDNNFTSIVAGIEEGRTIYNNIAKSLKYLLAGNTSELIVVFTALLVGWPLILLPIQLLWINLVTDGLPAIALATDPSDTGIMSRPPRNQTRPFMDRFFFQDVIFIAILTSLVTLTAFGYELLVNNDLTQARDGAFSVLVTAELLRAFGARSNSRTLFSIGILSNLRLFLIISISFSLQILIHHIDFLQHIFKIESVSMSECLSWVLLGSIPLIFLEIKKYLVKRE